MTGAWDLSWRSRAACLEIDPRTFFSDRGRPRNDAARPCSGCPVRNECLEAALASPWRPAGIFGGLTPSVLAPLWEARHDDSSRSERINTITGLIPAGGSKS